MSQRTAIVTGVDSGLGGAISQRLARDGAAVAVFDVNGDAAEAAAASINAAGGTAKFLLLPALGIKGNSHMLMMDKNNLQIADLIIGWLGPATEMAAKK